MASQLHSWRDRNAHAPERHAYYEMMIFEFDTFN